MSPKKPDEIAEKLNKNAVHFIRHSIDLLKNNKSDFALVAFYTGLELLIKARLCEKHWSLIIKSIDKSSKEQFVAGDSVTTGMHDANDRLSRVDNDGLPKQLLDCFDGVRKHRNRIVHFDHPARYENESRAKITAEMCLAWFLIQRHLSYKWIADNAYLQGEIRKIDFRMQELREYLVAKYDQVKDGIEVKVSKGAKVKKCQSCSFESLLLSDDSEIAFWDCLVCGNREVELRLPCTEAECNGEVVVHNEPPGICDSCDYKMELSELVEHFDPSGDPSSGWDESKAYCGYCECFDIGCGTVVSCLGHQWMCMNCMEVFDCENVESCDHCGQLQAPLPEGSAFLGCLMCDGKRI